MRLLILGGTGFVGRVLARQAAARGWDVTCAARGSAPVPEGVRFVQVDRDHETGLTPLTEAEWDAVTDVTRQPGHARRAVRDLRARHWVLISSGNAYARFDQPEQAEDAALLSPMVEDVLTDMSRYGEAKVACENAYRTAQDAQGSAASWTIVRSGLIGGDGDVTGRSGYYPLRFAHPTGTDVLVPDDPTFPVAMIDVEDLADWTLDCAERRIHGAFNAAGPTTPLATVLETARGVADSTAVPRPVDPAALIAADVQSWMGPVSLPLWLDDPDWRWFAAKDTTAARREGLRTRPLVDTLRAALGYENHREQPRAAGLSDEDEIRLRRTLPAG